MTVLNPDHCQSAQSDQVFLYESVAGKLTNAIHKGCFTAGERMPSIRLLAGQHKISMSTALQVYRVLEDRGLLVSRSRTGYFVRGKTIAPDFEPAISHPPDEPKPPINLQLGLRLHRLMTQPGLISLGVTADPAPSLVPSKAIGRTLAGVARRTADLAGTYSHSAGHPQLQAQIARRMADAGCYVAPDNIIVTVGCQESLNIALHAVARPGDTIAIESPTYIGVPHLLAVYGLKALEIPTHPQTGIDIDSLEQALSRHPIKACLFMPSCQNPLGASMPEANKRRLVDLLARAKIPLIEDDTMGDLSFERPRPKAAKAFDTSGNVLYCSSFAKTLGPGQRIGWIEPGRYRDAVIYLGAVFRGLSAPVWQQIGMAEFLAGGGYGRVISHAALAYEKRVMMMRNWVQMHFPPGTRVTNPSGGFVLWIELPGAVDVMKLQERALERGIGFTPGMLFSPSWTYTHHIRFGCGGSIDWNQVEPAVATLGKLANDMMR